MSSHTPQSPTENLDTFNSKFKLLRFFFERNFNKLNEETLKYARAILSFDETINLSTNALNEVKSLLMVQNNNSKFVINSIVKECIIIQDWMEKIDTINFELLNDVNSKEARCWLDIIANFEIVYIPITDFIKLSTIKQDRQSEVHTLDNQTENDFTVSTIEDYLSEFENKMSANDYQTLIAALKTYFNTGNFPKLSKQIQINGRVNKKKLGWAFNKLFEAKSKGIEKELLLFAKQNISLFSNVQFDENEIFKSNLYKYFTTKT